MVDVHERLLVGQGSSHVALSFGREVAGSSSGQGRGAVRQNEYLSGMGRGGGRVGKGE